MMIGIKNNELSSTFSWHSFVFSLHFGLSINKAKRFPKQQRSIVDIALASVYCYCLRSELFGWRRKATAHRGLSFFIG